ncbi:MAG: hypothetical protein EOL90_03170 [Spartobacteria bacterium]|nr:hypothetical protein [Spartobacteria bacterium]
MHRLRPSEDPARRWRRFCRPGARWAAAVAAIWFGAWTLLFRIAPVPAAPPRDPPGRMAWWWPAAGAPALDVRAHWTPAAFALSTPAGFSHALRAGRSDLAPPVQTERPAPAYGATPPAFLPLEGASPPSPAGPVAPVAEVFPPRTWPKDAPRLAFSLGWESRLFAGIDLDYPAWTNVAWKARMELRFDERGVPTSVLLAQASGIPAVDRRLARSASGWRLLEPSAPRSGSATWSAPGPADATAGGAP